MVERSMVKTTSREEMLSREEMSRRGHLNYHLRMGKARGLALVRVSLQGAPTRNREKVACFSIAH